MLVLTRKVEEKLVIDGHILIQVLQIKGRTIRLGITAPNDVKIVRSKLQLTQIKSFEPKQQQTLLD